MIRDPDLLSYLPEFIREYREIKAIAEAENPEIKTLDNETERLKNNEFILTCDEFGIKRFESMLDISCAPDDSLETRIFRVLTRWNDAIPYTYKVLTEKLDTICGRGNYEILPSFERYEMEFIVCLPFEGQVNELEYMLSRIIPANIKIISNNRLRCESTGDVKLGSATIQTCFFTTTTDLNKRYTSTGDLKFASAFTETGVYKISNDLLKSISVNGTEHCASTTAITTLFELK